VLIVAGILLFRHRPRDYYRLRNVCLISGLIGLVVFALFPVAPPRLTDMPVIDTVTRDADGYRQLLPASLVNEYAAMPSFHAGWNLVVGLVVFFASRRPLVRAFAILMPLTMIVAVVATANHFVIDVVAGVTIVLVVLLVELAFERLRLGRGDVLMRGPRHTGPATSVRRRPPCGERPESAAPCGGARAHAGRG
jgi:hypothetical protein